MCTYFESNLESYINVRLLFEIFSQIIRNLPLHFIPVFTDVMAVFIHIFGGSSLKA